MSNNTSENNSPMMTCFLKDVKMEIHVVLSFPSQGYYINSIICFLVNIILTLSTIIINSLTVLAYWKSSQLKKKCSYFLVMLLSLNDLGVGVLSNSTFTVFLAAEILGHGNCVFVQVFAPFTFLGFMSFATLIVLNFERYLGVCHVIFHRNEVTKKRCLMASALVWFAWALGYIVHYFIDENVGKQYISFLMTFYILALLFMYIKIFIRSRRRLSPASHNNQKHLTHNLKFVKSCIIVVGATSLCFLPSAVNNFLKPSVFSILVLRLWTTTLFFASATVNSVIFFWRNQILRNEAKKILRETLKLLSWRE